MERSGTVRNDPGRFSNGRGSRTWLEGCFSIGIKWKSKGREQRRTVRRVENGKEDELTKKRRRKLLGFWSQAFGISPRYDSTRLKLVVRGSFAFLPTPLILPTSFSRLSRVYFQSETPSRWYTCCYQKETKLYQLFGTMQRKIRSDGFLNNFSRHLQSAKSRRAA